MNKSYIGLNGPYMLCDDTMGEICIVDTRQDPPAIMGRFTELDVAAYWMKRYNSAVREAKERRARERAA